MAHSYDEAVSAWTRHLRSGGTTTWRDWVSPVSGRSTQPVETPLPDAVHLELVRRLNLVAGTDGAPGLADVVLSTPAPGRGRVEVPLRWPEAPAYGDPPIDPADVPDEELLRVAVGVLSRLLPGVPPPEAPRDLARWPMPWRRRFRLYGSPGTVGALRGALVAQGLVESDWHPVHVVIARPLDLMMAEHWAASAATGGRIPWVGLWRRAETQDALPRGLDVVATAERLAAGPAPVHLVVARAPQEVVAAVSAILRTAPFELPGAPDPELADLLQHVNRVTALRHGPHHVRRLAATLAHTMADPPAAGTTREPPAIPAGVLPWARLTARASAARTDEAGYIVHGDPGALAPHEPAHPASTDRRRTLELAIEACARTWHLQEETP